MIWMTGGNHWTLVTDRDYAAFITKQPDGYRAILQTPDHNISKYFYTHDTLEQAKEWCVVEVVKRRLT